VFIVGIKVSAVFEVQPRLPRDVMSFIFLVLIEFVPSPINSSPLANVLVPVPPKLTPIELAVAGIASTTSTSCVGTFSLAILYNANKDGLFTIVPPLTTLDIVAEPLSPLIGK